MIRSWVSVARTGVIPTEGRRPKRRNPCISPATPQQIDYLQQEPCNCTGGHFAEP